MSTLKPHFAIKCQTDGYNGGDDQNQNDGYCQS
jgi:hypothetical protein